MATTGRFDALAAVGRGSSVGVIGLLGSSDAFAGSTSASVAATFHVSPSRIQPSLAAPFGATWRLIVAGVSTNWTSGSTVTITDSVTGITNVHKLSWTCDSPTAGTITLGATTTTPSGQFKITIDGVDSNALTVGPRRKGWFGRMSRRYH